MLGAHTNLGLLTIRPKAVLVVEADDLATRACVCARGTDGQVRVKALAETKLLDLAEALAELIPALKSCGARIPSHAVLLSPHVRTVSLELPVDPAKPLPQRQFRELLRWEVDPYVSQHRARRIGTILVGRGYLRAADLDRLLREQASAAGRKLRRFGDCAVEAGLITEEQLEECLALQQTEAPGEGEVAYGWTAQDSTARNGNWPWAVAAMNGTLRQKVDVAFARRGLRLRAAYPLVGCACASLNGEKEGSCAVFEYQAGHIGYTRCDSKRVVSRRSAFARDVGNPIDACADLFEQDARQVWLAGRWPDMDGALRDLEMCLERPCERLAHVSGREPSSSPEGPEMAGALGAANHMLGRAESHWAVAVPGRDPALPIWRDRWALAFVVAAILSVAMARTGLYFKRSAEDTARVVEAGQGLAQRESERSRLDARNADLEKQIRFLRHTLPANRRQAAELLDILTECRSEEIILQHIDFAAGETVEIKGWGLTPHGIQAFKIDLQEKLSHLALVGEAKPIRGEKGWESLDGYAFEIRLEARDRKGVGRRR